MNTPQVEAVKVEVVEKEQKKGTMEFVDFKGGNEYCLEINDNKGVPIVQLLFNQANKWNTPRVQGEPAQDPDKSYIILRVGRITKVGQDGDHEVKGLRSISWVRIAVDICIWLRIYPWMLLNRPLRTTAS